MNFHTLSDVRSLNDFSHKLHLWMRCWKWNFFTCWSSAFVLGDILSQCGHFTGWEVCFCIWALRIYWFVSHASQILHWYFGRDSPLGGCTRRTWASTSPFVLNRFAQNSQISCLSCDGIEWIRSSWPFRSSSVWNLRKICYFQLVCSQKNAEPLTVDYRTSTEICSLFSIVQLCGDETTNESSDCSCMQMIFHIFHKCNVFRPLLCALTRVR